MRSWHFALAVLAASAAITPVYAHGPEGDTARVILKRVTPAGAAENVGLVTFADTREGLIVRPFLRDLEPGPHGAHVHENPDCGPKENDDGVVPGGAAGDHYDPNDIGQHAGPYGDGHLGDLPNLTVEHNGWASIPVLAPRLEVRDLEGRSFMIHNSPDRYGQHAQHSHGKGGMRMYCGVISVFHHEEER